MQKTEIIKTFLEKDYPPNSLFNLYKRAINYTEEHLQDAIHEIVFRHIDKEVKRVMRATNRDYKFCFNMILGSRA